MNNIVFFSTVGASLMAIIYAFFSLRMVNKAPIGSKKMADTEKLISKSIWSDFSSKTKNLALVSIILFTALMYAFGWQVAVSFLMSASILGLVGFLALEYSDKSNVRVAEAAKSGAAKLFSLILRTAFSSSLLIIATVSLLVALGYLAFGNLEAIYAVALAAVVTSIFSENENIFIGVFGVSLVASISGANEFLPGVKNALVFPLGIISGSIIISIIVSLFVRVKEFSNSNYAISVFKGVVVSGVLVLAGSYFFIKLLLIDNGKYAVLPLFLLFAAGLAVGIKSLIYFRNQKILPVVVAGILVVVANHFAGFYGISITLIGGVVAICLGTIFDPLAEIATNAKKIAASAELPEQVQENIDAIANVRIETNNYSMLLVVLSSFVLALILAQSLPTLGSKILDPKVFAGILFGGVLSYTLGHKWLSKEIYQIAAVVLAVVFSGFLLGPIFLAGVLAGLIIVNSLASEKTNNSAVLLGILSSILVNSFISDLYTLNIRLIIAGVLIVVAAAAFFWQKFPAVKKSFKLEDEK